MTIAQFHQLLTLLVSVYLPELTPDTKDRFTGPIVFTGDLKNGMALVARLWEGEKDGGLVCEIKENWQTPTHIFYSGVEYRFSSRRPWMEGEETNAWPNTTKVIFGGHDGVIRLDGVEETVRALRQLRLAIDKLKVMEGPPERGMHYPSE